MPRWYLFFIAVFFFRCSTATNDSPPNILWITTEDISPNLGAYGDSYAHTPNLDQLADEGVVYTNAFATAPVCAVARSSIITGMYAPSIGTQHMRCSGQLPESGALYPELLREAGYYVTNNVKTDYNLDMDPRSIWDASTNKAHWRDRPDPEQPFFAIFNFTTTHESRVNQEDRYVEAIKELPENLQKKPGEVPLPPYYPEDEDVHVLLARYYNIIAAMDRQVGEVLQELQEDGLEDDTIVIFYSDHGAGLPRHKRWMYDTGLRVPLIVRVPEKYRELLPYEPGEKIDELVSFVDLPATALHLAGVPVPDSYQGRPFLGTHLTPPREYVYAGRDRMDERYDMQRSVRSKTHKYIRYYEPYKPFSQYMNTPEKGAIMMALRKADEANTMPEEGSHIMAATKPEEALFDITNDPFELNNLAEDPVHRQTLNHLREVHSEWSDEIKDTGLIPETILRKWEQEHQASIYDILRDNSIDISEIRKTATGEKTHQELLESLLDANEAVRYWAAIQLGNRAAQLEGAQPLEERLSDEVPAVRIAAARALGEMNQPQKALPVLTTALTDADDWVRLFAAQVLDEMGEQASPAIPLLHSALNDSNRYVVRVVNRALNELEGTSRVVP